LFTRGMGRSRKYALVDRTGKLEKHFIYNHCKKSKGAVQNCKKGKELRECKRWGRERGLGTGNLVEVIRETKGKYL